MLIYLFYFFANDLRQKPGLTAVLNLLFEKKKKKERKFETVNFVAKKEETEGERERSLLFLPIFYFCFQCNCCNELNAYNMDFRYSCINNFFFFFKVFTEA